MMGYLREEEVNFEPLRVFLGHGKYDIRVDALTLALSNDPDLLWLTIRDAHKYYNDLMN